MVTRGLEHTEHSDTTGGFGGTVRNLLIGMAAGIFAGAAAFMSEAVFSYADTLAVLF